MIATATAAPIFRINPRLADDPLQRVIAFAAGKGGVGKTTGAREVMARFASRGLRVAGFDFDPQGHLGLTLGLKKQPGIARLLDGQAAIDDVLVPVPPERWFEGPAQGELYIVPGNPDTQAASMRLFLNRAPLTLIQDLVLDLIERRGFDLVIFDTAPSINPITPWVYASAAWAIVPMDGGIESLEGIKQTQSGFTIAPDGADEIELVKLLGILPVRVNDRFVVHQLALEAVPELVERDDMLFPFLEPLVAWQEAAWRGVAMSVYARSEPRAAKAEQQMQAVYRMVLSKLVRLGVLERV